MILYDCNKILNDWVSLNVLGITGVYDDSSKAIGNVIDGKLVSAVTYNNFRVRPDGSFLSVEMGIYSNDKKWATKDYLRAVFSYPFIQLGMERVETTCSAGRPDVIAFNQKLGFKKECIKRKAWPLGGDAVQFSMLRDECKWLTKTA